MQYLLCGQEASRLSTEMGGAGSHWRGRFKRKRRSPYLYADVQTCYTLQPCHQGTEKLMHRLGRPSSALHCTLNCTLYSALLYPTLPCSIVLCTLYPPPSTISTLLCTLFSRRSILYSVLSTLCSLLSTLHFLLSTLYSLHLKRDTDDISDICALHKHILSRRRPACHVSTA